MMPDWGEKFPSNDELHVVNIDCCMREKFAIVSIWPVDQEDNTIVFKLWLDFASSDKTTVGYNVKKSFYDNGQLLETVHDLGEMHLYINVDDGSNVSSNDMLIKRCLLKYTQGLVYDDELVAYEAELGGTGGNISQEIITLAEEMAQMLGNMDDARDGKVFANKWRYATSIATIDELKYLHTVVLEGGLAGSGGEIKNNGDVKAPKSTTTVQGRGKKT